MTDIGKPKDRPRNIRGVFFVAAYPRAEKDTDTKGWKSQRERAVLSLLISCPFCWLMRMPAKNNQTNADIPHSDGDTTLIRKQRQEEKTNAKSNLPQLSRSMSPPSE